MGRLSVSGADGPVIELDGRRLISFGGCNYLGLSWHPEVRGAFGRALAQYGVSTSASRETTGNTVEHDRLEDALREFLGVEAAVAVPDGYTANLATAQALAATHQVALVDARCHRSIREAVIGSGMELHVYGHRDAADAGSKLSALVRGSSRRASVWTDGVFAADGAVAPVPELLSACREHGATLVIDDCHGFCALGASGRGTLEHFGMGPESVVITTTLSKGLGCHGGVVAGAAALAGTIRSGSSAYICTTPASPAIAAAAAEAIAVVRREPERFTRLRQNAARLWDALGAAAIRVERGPAPVCAFTLPTLARMRGLHEDLISAGFLAPLIDYPDGPAPAYFRVSATSEHTSSQIDAFGSALRGAMVDSADRSRTVGQTAG